METGHPSTRVVETGLYAPLSSAPVVVKTKVPPLKQTQMHQVNATAENKNFTNMLTGSCSKFASQVLDTERHHAKPLEITAHSCQYTNKGHNFINMIDRC